jgi:RNA polymerase sigma-70 factor (ECF subfamily)
MDAVRAEPHVAEAARVGQAFTDFYALHRAPLVRALAVTLSNSALAAEAVDEAMTRAVQRWDKISGYSAPEGWVYRVAYNWATSRFRRLRRDRTFAPVIARSDVVEHDTFDHDLHDALATLSKEHRAVLTLRFLLDWNVESTASALGVSPGTVKSRTSRALDVLAGRLEHADAVPEEKDDVS